MVKLTYEDICKKIVDAIPLDCATKVTPLAKKIGAHPNTVRRWLGIIAFCQNLPKIRVILYEKGSIGIERIREKTIEENLL